MILLRLALDIQLTLLDLAVALDGGNSQNNSNKAAQAKFNCQAHKLKTLNTLLTCGDYHHRVGRYLIKNTKASGLPA